MKRSTTECLKSQITAVRSSLDDLGKLIDDISNGKHDQEHSNPALTAIPGLLGSVQSKIDRLIQKARS